MRRQTLLKLLSAIAVFILLAVLLAVLVVKPWVERKILALFQSAEPAFTIKAEKIKTDFLPPGVEFNGVSILSNKSKGALDIEAGSIKFSGINIFRLILRNDLYIREVIITNSDVHGRMAFSSVQHIISSLNIVTQKILFKKVNLEVKNAADAESWLIRDGFFIFYDFKLEKKDTLLFNETGPSDFQAAEVTRVSTDSFYTFRAVGIRCSSSSRSLQVDSFLMLPNYKDYDFTSRHEFQTDCINAEAVNISADNFIAADYFRTKALVSSRIAIKQFDIKVFRDRRKKTEHKKQLSLQGLLYRYPARIRIDSLNVSSGSILYTEHGENSKEPGSIHFEKVHAGIYHLTNDTAYKTKNALMEFRADAAVMGKARLTCEVKAKLFDSTDAFTLSGGLSKMDVRDLNPILERNAFIHAESGEIDTFSFNLAADNFASTGTVTMLYHIFFVKAEAGYAVVPASLMQLVVSAIASKKILDANPAEGEPVRAGVIAYQRDPERSVINYWYKSVLSGIKSVISENQK